MDITCTSFCPLYQNINTIHTQLFTIIKLVYVCKTNCVLLFLYIGYPVVQSSKIKLTDETLFTVVTKKSTIRTLTVEYGSRTHVGGHAHAHAQSFI